MSTIELDPASLLALDESEWRLLALAGETPHPEDHPASPDRLATARSLLTAIAAEGPAPIALPVACFAPDPADAAPGAFATGRRPQPTACPPLGELERERALGPSFAPET